MPDLDELVAQHNPPTAKPVTLDEALAAQEAQPQPAPSLSDRIVARGKAKAAEVAAKPLLGQIVPSQVAGLTKGVINTVTAPAQAVAHAFGSSVVDPLVDAVDREYQQNWQPNPVMEAVGGAVPLLAIPRVAMTAAPSAVQKAIAFWRGLNPIAKGAATGAALTPALTPETNVQNGQDFARRKLAEAGAGALLGGAIPAAAQGVQAIARGAQTVQKAPAPGAFLEQLGKRFTGTPGEALQSAAQAKYDAAWDTFKKAMAPVDAAAGGTAVDYSPAIQKIEALLGVGQKRSPARLNAETQKTLEGLLADLRDAQSGGAVDNSFAGAIDTIKWLGQEQRRLAVAHKDTQARELLGGVRDSILEAMNLSDPKLAQAAKDARSVFAREVVPLFDKSEGGNFLTKIRDSATPGDLLVSGNQGALTRMKPDKAAIIAKGSSADPMLYSYLESAINESKENPRIFADSLKKAMPAVEAIADPKTLEAFQGMVKIADAANKGGKFANLAAGALAAKSGHEVIGAGLAGWGIFNPTISGPGYLWKVLQSPATKKLLSYAAKLPANSPELNLIAKDLVKAVPGATSASASPATGAKALSTAYRFDEPQQ